MIHQTYTIPNDLKDPGAPKNEFPKTVYQFQPLLNVNSLTGSNP